MFNKRFIAGAICPQCQAMDKIFTYQESAESDIKWRACVQCGFKEPFADTAAKEELATRVNRHKLGEQPLAHEVPVQAVKLIDPK